MLPPSAYETVLRGGIAVVPDFLPRDVARALRDDATDLHRSGHFAADALAAYGERKEFDPSRDRTVLKLDRWKREDLGDAGLRHGTFASIMGGLRSDLARNLGRPMLETGASVTSYGKGSTEISYTRFGPGAYLKRHVDEHHEELKGRRGWEKPTRRSISWLIYLNDHDWDPAVHGGSLRCFRRRADLSEADRVGARDNGDLQIGWLRPTATDPTERPVFLDGRRPNPNGHCAMYLADDGGGTGGARYISGDFHPSPALFVSGSELLARRLLIDSPSLAPRFHFIEPPKSAASELLRRGSSTPSAPFDDEVAVDVPPLGGTLVVFDSVSLPHEVLPAIGRERWASSGWFHEDQQEEPHFYMPRPA